MKFRAFQFRPVQTETYNNALHATFLCSNDPPIRVWDIGGFKAWDAFRRCAATMDEVLAATE